MTTNDHDVHAEADTGATGSHAKHASHVPTYVLIFLTLGLLTVVEVFVPDVYSAEWNKHTKMLLLSILAVAKAMLVGLYFMHLKWEKPWLKYIALMPAYMGLFAILLMLETVYRAPGA
jgi:cytochrome c oxidase subunit 4